MLIEFFSQQAQKSMRSKFTRLSQISSLLNLENANDVIDIWNDKSEIKWKITPEEAKMMLRKRVDMKRDEIESLSLQNKISVNK